MCDHENREAAMTVIARDANGRPTIWCDPCLEPLIRALNDADIRTDASCCGHGHRPGLIMLADGRELIVCRSYEEARVMERAWPVDINGDAVGPEVPVPEVSGHCLDPRAALRHLMDDPTIADLVDEKRRLTSVIRALVERIERTGGHATPGEQAAYWTARELVGR